MKDKPSTPYKKPECEIYCQEKKTAQFALALTASFLAGLIVWWIQRQNQSQDKEQV